MTVETFDCRTGCVESEVRCAMRIDRPAFTFDVILWRALRQGLGNDELKDCGGHRPLFHLCVLNCLRVSQGEAGACHSSNYSERRLVMIALCTIEGRFGG